MKIWYLERSAGTGSKRKADLIYREFPEKLKISSPYRKYVFRTTRSRRGNAKKHSFCDGILHKN